MKKIVLYGYFGHQNFGDDLMLHNIVDIIGKKNLITIISSNKDYTDIQDNNVVIYETYKENKIKNLILFCKIFYNKDYFVWGGGTCFSENDGVVNPVILFLAKLLGLKIIFIGIGANKVISFKNTIKMKINSMLIDKIYARDDESIKNLSTFFKREKLILSEDIAYLYNYNNIQADISQLTISLRNLDNYITNEKKELFIRNSVNSIQRIINDSNFVKVNILVLDNNIDYEISLAFFFLLKNKINSNVELNIINENKFNKKIECIQKSGLFICVRLHGILVSELLGNRTIGIGYSEKVKSYMERVKSPGYISIEEIIDDEDVLFRKFINMKENSFDIDIEKQKEKALINFEIFNID